MGRGNCSGEGLHRFFAQETPCKRLVDGLILRPIAERIMSKKASSLVIVGSKPEQHVLDHFYGLGVKHMTIVERDEFMANKIREYIKTSTRSRKISLIQSDANHIFYGGYTHIDLDFMNCFKTQLAVKRALEEQARDYERRMKSFIFTQGIRNAPNEGIFKYINEIIGILGASLKGFNGEVGQCQNGTPILEKLGRRIYCKENIPNFAFIGNRLKELKCYSYRDKGHGGMVTTMLIYR
jgi:hypothetical protein